MEQDFLDWHNDILAARYEMERMREIAYEAERQEFLKQKWILEDCLRVAERFIPLNRTSEYLEAAYGRKS